MADAQLWEYVEQHEMQNSPDVALTTTFVNQLMSFKVWADQMRR
jgi:hypothetical protein